MKSSIYEKYGKKIVDIKNFIPSCDNIIIMGADILMSGYQTILFCAGIVIAALFFALLFLNKKDDKFKVLKKITLVAMVSTGLFISLYLVFGYSEYKVEKDDAGIAILGVLATVWVGLNIYNVIEKREVDSLKEELRDSLEKINELRKDLRESKDEMDKKLYDVEKNNFIQNTFTMCSMKKIIMKTLIILIE